MFHHHPFVNGKRNERRAEALELVLDSFIVDIIGSGISAYLRPYGVWQRFEIMRRSAMISYTQPDEEWVPVKQTGSSNRGGPLWTVEILFELRAALLVLVGGCKLPSSSRKLRVSMIPSYRAGDVS
jgi:hypothetical protein